MQCAHLVCVGQRACTVPFRACVYSFDMCVFACACGFVCPHRLCVGTHVCLGRGLPLPMQKPWPWEGILDSIMVGGRVGDQPLVAL